MSARIALLPAAAPGAAFGKIVRNEARLAWRQRTGLVAGVGLPVLLLVVFAELPKFQRRSPSFGGLTEFDVYLPVLVVLAVTLLAVWSVPGPLVSYREQGVLRRLATTPVPPAWLLAAQVVVQLCLAVTGTVIVIVVGVTAYGVPAPKSLGGLVVSCALCIAGLFSLGLSIAALARTSGTANVMGRLAFFPLMFFGGLWLPLALMPDALRDISDYTPVGASVEAIQDSMQGTFPPAAPLLALAGFAVTFSFVAWRFFRWE